jgi:hypothetical protein
MSASVVPAIVAARMRRYRNAFRAAGAITPATAIRLADTGLRESLIFQRLVREGILVPVGNGRYYLDEVREAAVQRMRHRILAIVLLIVLVGLAISLISAL